MVMAAKLLQGKVSLITGASKGIGAAIARKFAENGAKLAITALPNEGVSDVSRPECSCPDRLSSLIVLAQKVRNLHMITTCNLVYGQSRTAVSLQGVLFPTHSFVSSLHYN